MTVLAVLATIAAFGWSFVVFWANGMRSSPGHFEGRFTIIAAWAAVVVLWLWWSVS